MSRRPTLLLALVLALAGLAVAAGCGTEEETEVPEGEPLELGDVVYNVQTTRFLNPFSTEDASYLEGAPPLEQGKQYLGVFLAIHNDGEAAGAVPDPFKIVDTRGTVYEQQELGEENSFALQPGTPLEPGGEVPGPETAAANGSIEGSLVLFAIDETATEDRPLQLEVPGPDGGGSIELDL